MRARVSDDLRRSRVLVLFRLPLAVPHLVWLALWTVAAVLAGLANWGATLARGASPAPLHRFLERYVRYTLHVNAFLLLAGNPFPGFAGEPGTYPVDLELSAPTRQSRWLVAFRLPLAVPALLVRSTLALAWSSLAPLLGWFASLVTGRMPRGFRDTLVYVLRYSAQLDAYLLVLTPRYPDSNPVAEGQPRDDGDHPVRLAVTDDLRRSRVTVFFRPLLAIPHVVWLGLWGYGAAFAALPAWLVVLFDRRPPGWATDFLGGYVRYATHVHAYLALAANPFPGFLGREGTYPVDVRIEAGRLQNRWTIGFRFVLVFPALLVAGALGNLLWTAAFLGWFASLATGRMPLGLRNAAAYVVRYNAQTYAYGLLLTGSYPHSGAAVDLPEAAPAPDPPGAPLDLPPAA